MEREAAILHVRAGLAESARLKSAGAGEWSPLIVRAASAISESLSNGGKVLFCGNGGSAADAQHLAAEFVGRFQLSRRALPAVALTTDSSILTAIGNDFGYEHVFVRQVEALGRQGDVLVGISTSGNSPNVVEAVRTARASGMVTIAFAGRDGGALSRTADIVVVVPSSDTARIQECHIALGHVMCELVERTLFHDDQARS